VIALLVCATGVLPAQAQEHGTVLTPKQRERERKAMSAYAATRYQEALDIYADLYADFHDPLYLRNIGRCHQKLRHADEAIASFEEYLSKYKRLSAAEIEEVQGWIAEMKELQKAQAPAPARSSRRRLRPRPRPRRWSRPAPPPAPVAAPPPVELVQKAPPPDEGPRNVGVRRAGIGLLVLGGALAVAGGVFEATSWNKYNSARTAPAWA
jgi:tetratricopeptide (TPR) repeat protein